MSWEDVFTACVLAYAAGLCIFNVVRLVLLVRRLRGWRPPFSVGPTTVSRCLTCWEAVTGPEHRCPGRRP